MHIVYIEFAQSKSSQYKKVCNLAKQFPNYSSLNGITTCSVDNIKDYVRLQDIIYMLIDKVHKWKNAKILLYDNIYKSAMDYYNFVEKLKNQAGKYKIFIRYKNEYSSHRGIVTYEDLPMPVVYYPGSTGAFFAFSEDVGEQIYFCECERHAIENYLRLKQQRTSSETYEKEEAPLSERLFPPIVASMSRKHKNAPLTLFDFKKDLCFRCNKKIPKEKYCSPMYGGVFKQKYGWYIKQEEIRLGIDRSQIQNHNFLIEECTPEIYDCVCRLSRLLNERNYGTDHDNVLSKAWREYDNAIENIVRIPMGYPKIGDAWISETMLYHIVEAIYPDIEVFRHYRPNWLEGLELDIYIPSQKLAFEYQGIQHFQAIKHWGGKSQLAIQQEHDIRKKRICKENGIHLICIYYNEEITTDYIAKRIELELELVTKQL